MSVGLWLELRVIRHNPFIRLSHETINIYWIKSMGLIEANKKWICLKWCRSTVWLIDLYLDKCTGLETRVKSGFVDAWRCLMPTLLSIKAIINEYSSTPTTDNKTLWPCGPFLLCITKEPKIQDIKIPNGFMIYWLCWPNSMTIMTIKWQLYLLTVKNLFPI